MWSSRRKPEFPRKGQKNWNIGLAKRALSHDSQHQLHSVPPSAGTDQPPAVPHADDPKKPYNPNALYVKKLYWGVAIEGDVHEQVDELTLYKRMAQSGTAWAILHQKMVKAKVDKQKIAVVMFILIAMQELCMGVVQLVLIAFEPWCSSCSGTVFTPPGNKEQFMTASHDHLTCLFPGGKTASVLHPSKKKSGAAG